MPLTCAQIVNLACQDAKVPGFTSQGGMHLNMALADLAMNWDFDLQKNESFSITTSGGPNSQGPYTLPADYLRHADGEILFLIDGQPIKLYQRPLSEFKSFFVGGGVSTYPEFFSIDFSTPGVPKAYLWPPPNGAYVIFWPYQKAHADILNPETSNVVPWFPMSSYLVKEVAARLCSGNDDDRATRLSGEAMGFLKSYQELKDDKEGYAIQIKLDQRNFPGRGVLKGDHVYPWRE